ncbi:MAG: hypothetical protein JO161_02965 [Planctomycetaceae bacterium]|nr:hypothetical protein [Planctomycetaceae bacterium]
MLKPLTLSLSLAVALGFCSLSMAGHGDGCSGCGLASPQAGPIPSAQGPVATGCEIGCAPKKSCFSGLHGQFSGLHCKLKNLCNPPVCYEWVLKKKRLWGHHGGGCGGGCAETCAAPVYPTSQVAPSGQGVAPAPTGQGGYTAPQAAPIYGVGQHAYKAAKPTATIASVPSDMTPAVAGEEAPPAPEVKESSASGLLLPTPSGN